MDTAQLQQMATQSASQGQNLLNQDQSQQAQNQGQYTNYSNQANAANQNLQNYLGYMQGAGSGANQYNTELGTLQQQSGYNPAQLQAANQNLFQMTGAANAANNQFNTAGGMSGAAGWSPAALASYEGNTMGALNTGMQNANTQVGTLNSELGTLMTGANQGAGLQMQGEQATETGLSQAFTNAQAQAAQAAQMAQFYGQLAQQQGGLNAQQQQAYATAIQGYTTAAAAAEQAQAAMMVAQAQTKALGNTPATVSPAIANQKSAISQYLASPAATSPIPQASTFSGLENTGSNAIRGLQGLVGGLASKIPGIGAL